MTRRRRIAWWLGGSLGAVVLLAVLAIGALLWALSSASGSAWLLTLSPQLKVVAPKGSLLGDFSAERLDITLAGTGVLRLDAPRWHALAASRGDHGRWLHLVIDTLHANRVLWLPATDAKPSTGPATPPSTLRLPIELEVREASVDELRIGSADAFPIRAVRARVHLGAEGGAQHRFDEASARVEQANAQGSLAIGADSPFTAAVSVLADSVGATPAFQVRATATGPLAALNVTATARVAASATHAAQSLDAHATVAPFAAWPLGELQAKLDALDLSAFSTAAPATSLTGTATVATQGMNVPAALSLDVANSKAGRWNEGLLPVTRAVAELRARPDQPGVLEVQALTAELGSAARNGGRVVANGRWTADAWNVDATLAAVRPIALDARAPDTALAGTVKVTGSGFTAAATRAVDLVAQLTGQLADPRLPKQAPKAAKLRLEARATHNAIEIRTAEASLGDATAALAGSLVRSATDAPWRARGKAQLARFDPAPWWPGSGDSPLARGANRIDAKSEFDLVLPPSAAAASTTTAAKSTATPTLFDQLAALRGNATLKLADSLLAGIALGGDASFANADGQFRSKLDMSAAGNRIQAEGRLAAAGSTRDEWRLAIDAPKLDALAPLLGPLPSRAGAPAKSTAPRLAGTLTAKAEIAGRWPDVTSSGEIQAAGLRYDSATVRQASGRWRAGSADAAVLDGLLTIDGTDLGGRAIEHAQARLSGTARAHTAELRIDSAALPPQWVDALSGRAAAVTTNGAASAVATPTAAPAATTAAATAPSVRSTVTLAAEGGLVDVATDRAAGWRGSLRELTARPVAAPARPWLQLKDIRGSVFWSGGPMRATLEPGSAEALGARLQWSKVAWQEGSENTAARLDVQASVDSFAVAPALRALQPDFGWGGDLIVGARIDVRSAPSTHVDFTLERKSGDLTVTDEIGVQPLGITELRAALTADQGVWKLSSALAGSSYGTASANVTARTSATAAWPDAQTPIEGTVDVRIANLGTWGNWVPAGWRLTGEVRGNARVGGRFGAPEYTGRVEGERLGVRNFLEGVNVTEGTVAIALRGTSARIEKFTAKGGAGTIRLEGDAAFDEAPTAQLRLIAERFELLGRVDRRIVASGNAALRLDAKTIALNGDFKVDEGTIDFTRSDAPTLGSDVEVVRRPPPAPAPDAATAAATAAAAKTAAKTASPATDTAAAAAATAAATPIPITPARTVALDLRVAMGDALRVRGRGLDAGLRGELRITSPGGRIAVAGTLRTEGGTYQAYGQKLGIDRGILTFAGPVENPRLDIEATRPDTDVRVGVVVSGTALYPRIRLFSEPELSDLDKLSWLVLGRASETTGGADTALLQQAALALLSGEGPGVTDRLIQSIGLDAVSVRQSSGAVKDTIVSLGKQISKRWYVGYERGLNTTNGTWQLIYRVAQRVTVRAEAGSDNAVDVTWTLRWK